MFIIGMNNQNRKQKMKNKSIYLIKYGGNAMTHPHLKIAILQGICQLKTQGHAVVLVHGGGPFIQQALDKARIHTAFVGGHRQTPAEALEPVETALKITVNSDLVRHLQGLGEKAVGLSGQDGNLLRARKRFHREQSPGGEWVHHDLGHVGDVDSIDPTLIQVLLQNDFLPVITCLANDQQGERYNINADLFAGHLAGALQVKEFLILTDVDGLLENRHDPHSLIPQLRLAELKTKQESGTIQGGMIPKLEACAVALQTGAQQARIINGTQPEQLTALLHNPQIGTLITHDNGH